MRILATCMLASALLAACTVNVTASDPPGDRIDSMILEARAGGSIPVLIHPMGEDGAPDGRPDTVVSFLHALHASRVTYDPAAGLVYATLDAHQLASLDAAQLCSAVVRDFPE
jgi:hypothetical protein